AFRSGRPRLLQDVLDEQGFELARHLHLRGLVLAALAGVAAQLRKLLGIEDGHLPPGAGTREILHAHQMISRSARKAPALLRFCRMDNRSCGVAPRALRARTTSARFALVRTRCREPPWLRISIWVLSDTT